MDSRAQDTKHTNTSSYSIRGLKEGLELEERADFAGGPDAIKRHAIVVLQRMCLIIHSSALRYKFYNLLQSSSEVNRAGLTFEFSIDCLTLKS